MRNTSAQKSLDVPGIQCCEPELNPKLFHRIAIL